MGCARVKATQVLWRAHGDPGSQRRHSVSRQASALEVGAGRLQGTVEPEGGTGAGSGLPSSAPVPLLLLPLPLAHSQQIILA